MVTMKGNPLSNIKFDDDAFSTLHDLANVEEDGRSSFWSLLQTDFRIDASGFAGVGPIGTFSKKTDLLRTVAHWLLQIPFRHMGRSYPTFREMNKLARRIAKRQGRQYDGDFLRHVLTLAMLRAKLPLENETDPILIIGDGYANMSSIILAALPQSRIVLINLTKTLLVDLYCLRQGVPDLRIAHPMDAEGLAAAVADDSVRVIALRADQAPMIATIPIPLGINIQSMMEMDHATTAQYFDVMRRSPRTETAFYCCNNASKKLPDGTVSDFYKYPWRDTDRMLVDDLCPWLRYRYTDRVPFYVRRNPNPQRLVYLEKEQPAVVP